MNKTNGRSDQLISSESEDEVAKVLDTPESKTTIFGVASKNNDEFGASSNECEDTVSSFHWYQKPDIPCNQESRTIIRGEVFKNDNKWNANFSEKEKSLFTETRHETPDFANNTESIMKDYGNFFKKDNEWEVSVNDSLTETVNKLQSKESDIKQKWEKVIKMRDLVLDEQHQLESKIKVAFKCHIL